MDADHRSEGTYRADEQGDPDHQQRIPLHRGRGGEPEQRTNGGGTEHHDCSEDIANHNEREYEHDTAGEQSDRGVAIENAPELRGTDDRGRWIAEDSAHNGAEDPATAAHRITRVVAADADAMHHPAGEDSGDGMPEFVHEGREEAEILPGRARKTERRSDRKDPEQYR